MSIALVWLRRDLRWHDHAAISLAQSLAEKVCPVFIYEKVILDQLPDRKDRRVRYIQESVQFLDDNSPLLTGHGDPVELIPRIASEAKASIVIASHDDDPYAIQRDQAVAKKLANIGIEWRSVKDHVIFERTEILNQSGQPHRVFTPYKKAWLDHLHPPDFAEQSVDTARLWIPAKFESAKRGNHTLGEIGYEDVETSQPGGSRHALNRLKEFATQVQDYAKTRDFPALDGTSLLGTDLRHGTISIRECVRLARSHPSEGARVWLSELIWREFFQMILANFPHVVEQPFQLKYKDLKWPGEAAHFDAWATGMTGFPLVDAAMRCLNQTGRMHNRLRMITAMFLTKDLLLDYRLGERYFAERLLDFELASNNGGWQWCASVGVDAQPYFRVFNPVTQSQKFDPECRFIKQWCPELSHLDAKSVHMPSEKVEGYPSPIVDHATQRVRAIAMFRGGAA